MEPEVHPLDLEMARARLRSWVERDVSDWYDPVLAPQVVDDLRLVLGMEPEERS